METIYYDHDFTEEKVLEADYNYKMTFIPEYFENRWPRNLDLASFPRDPAEI
jgi:hypothetical protein